MHPKDILAFYITKTHFEIIDQACKYRKQNNGNHNKLAFILIYRCFVGVYNERNLCTK